jgi:hypothetical protein
MTVNLEQLDDSPASRMYEDPSHHIIVRKRCLVYNETDQGLIATGYPDGEDHRNNTVRITISPTPSADLEEGQADPRAATIELCHDEARALGQFLLDYFSPGGSWRQPPMWIG